MKKYVAASQFPSEGSARYSDLRNGIIPFARGNSSVFYLNDNWEVSLATAKVTYDVNLGTIDTYLNIYVTTRPSSAIPKPSAGWYGRQFFAYTPEEAEELLSALREMTDDELCELTLQGVKH